MFVAIFLFFTSVTAALAQSPITLNVDATDAAKNIIHSKLRIPVKPVAPGMKILSVNGRSWSTDVLHQAIASAKNNTPPIELVVENGSFNETYTVNYHGGERYPQLERDNTKPDVLGDVIKARRAR